MFAMPLGVAALSLGVPSGVAASAGGASVGAVSLALAPVHRSRPVTGGTATSAQPGWAAYNWSGYAVTSSSPYTSVTGQWTVPSVTGPNGSYSAAWVGIDGFTNGSLIQTGTEQNYANNSGQYSAWWTSSAQGLVEQTITGGCTSTTAGTAAAQGRNSQHGGSGGGGGGSGGGGGGSGPTVTTDSATSVNSSSAILNGSVNPNGVATTYWFEYGTSTSYGSSTAHVSVGSVTTTVSVSATVGNLSPGTAYDFRLVAQNSKHKTTDGANATFTTSLSSGGGSGGGGAACGTVAPGDVMTASISETNASTSSWTITLSDTTGGWTFDTTLTYRGPGTSAEWILEAPSLCNAISCTTATLADYGTATFDPGTANGVDPGLQDADGGEMVNSTNTAVISMPSSPDSDTDGFAVAYGTQAPNPPSS